MHQALYRKYRPYTFNDVVGQDSIIKTLQNSISNHKFCHAYIFFGPRGTGKTSISKIFARAVNCLEPFNGNACGTCNNCLKSAERECVDIIEIDAASNNGVDEIRELRNKISLVPAELKYKVYIIDEVHMLSIGAFNALLKTLEEPPEHAIFILATTDSQKIPETIISRCQVFSFKRISENMLIQQLTLVCEKENIDIDENVLREIAISSDGGMRDSLGLLDKVSSYSSDRITMDLYVDLNGLITKQQIELFVYYIFSNNIAEVLKTIHDFNDCGKNIIQILVQTMYYLRDLIINYYIKQESISYSLEGIEGLINIINEKTFDIKKSGNPIVFIEVLLLKYMNSLSENISREINQQSKEEVGVTPVSKGIFNSKDFTSDLSIIRNNMGIVDSTSTLSTNETLEKNISREINQGSNVIYDTILDTKKVETDINSLNSSVTNLKIYEDYNPSISQVTTSQILNLPEIMRVRVNNTLALANKQLLNQEISNLEILKDFTFDQEIGYLVCEVLNSKFRAASGQNIIISYEYDSIVDQNLLHFEQMEEVYSKITNSFKHFAIISDREWDRVKKEYIELLKDGNHYLVQDEPDKVFKKEENDVIISSDTIHLFGDIVEID